VVPAGAAAEVSLTYTPDQPYRWAIFAGLGLLVLLLGAALLPGRRGPFVPLEPLRPPRWLVGFGFVAVVWLFLAGPVAALMVAAALLVANVLQLGTQEAVRWKAAVVATGCLLVAGALLATVGRTEAGSTAHGLTQLIGVLALTAVVTPAVRRSSRAGHEPVDR
jgi:arabinofuranan 3-O-arabinosyltransferase